MTAYFDQVRRMAGEIRDLELLAGLLAWDQETTMPAEGADARARHMALLHGEMHRRLVDPRLEDALEDIGEGADLGEEDRAELRLLIRRRKRAVNIPARLVEALAKAESLGYRAWMDARANDDFSRFQPALEELLALKQEESAAIGTFAEPYDAHLDTFEPGLTTAATEPLLTRLAEGLRPLLAAALEVGRARPLLPAREYDLGRQRLYSEGLAERLGFDRRAGRFDLAVHPFIVGVDPGDVRLTSRFLAHNLIEGVLATVHETGHALYEQGMPREWSGRLIADSPSFGIHESQSRLWENHVGRSLAFWEGEVGHLLAAMPELEGITPAMLHGSATVVAPSLIRIEADELTYPFHIILRFELELAMFRGDLSVADLPGAFRDGMQRLLGVNPPNDVVGVLQDVHWAHGSFGYFPTYLLGSIYGAALYDRAVTEAGGDQAMDEMLRAGEFEPLLEWLRRNVHSRGATVEARELVRQVTGMPSHLPVDPTAYLDRLSQRYAQGG